MKESPWKRNLRLGLLLLSCLFVMFSLGYWQGSRRQPTERIVVQEVVRTVTVEVEKKQIAAVVMEQKKTKTVQKLRVEKRKDGTVISENTTTSTGNITNVVSTSTIAERSKVKEEEKSKTTEVVKNNPIASYRLGFQVNPLDTKQLPSITGGIRLSSLPVWVTGRVDLLRREFTLGVEIEL